MLAVSRIVDTNLDIQQKSKKELGSMTRIYQQPEKLSVDTTINAILGVTIAYVNEEKSTNDVYDFNENEKVIKNNSAILNVINSSVIISEEQSTVDIMHTINEEKITATVINHSAVAIDASNSSSSMVNTAVINDIKIEKSFDSNPILDTKFEEHVQISEEVHMVVEDYTVAAVAVEMKDFLIASKSVQPSAKREGFAVVPDVTWGKKLRKEEKR